jgi:ABC-type dipeptide/oligopeptide/nickel transport system permease component
MTVFVIVGVTIIAFILGRIAPGDPAVQMLPSTATAEQIQAMRERMGLDQSYIMQYFIYMKNLLSGDLGYSFHYKMDCVDIIFPRLWETAKLTIIGVVFGFLVSIPLGLLAGIKRGSAIDTTAVGFALLGQAMSPVWLCLLMILVFSVWLGWLPSHGSGSWMHMIMPAFCLGVGFSSMITRMLRISMIDILQEDYIVATRARGISKFKVYTKYAFKNAILPVVTISGQQIGIMLCGSVVVEQIFSWPGFGELTIVAISSRDFQLVQSILVVVALIMVICNIIIDILYPLIDKRISFN